MIRRIYSDLPKFKNLELRSGLNVLLADKASGATDRQTRNRAGKTSLVEVIHFLLGADCRKDSIFRTEALDEASFGMDFDLDGSTVQVSRRGVRFGQVCVNADATTWPIVPVKKPDGHWLSNDDWATVLGAKFFGLVEPDVPWSPKFRQLVSYFIRRERSGGFHSPMMQANQQKLADQQVALSFLIGLDWTVPQQWQGVREREERLKQLKRALGDGILGSAIGTAGSLRPQLLYARERSARLAQAVAGFRVVAEYHDLEKEASTLTREVAELADECAIDRQYLQELEASTSVEVPPGAPDLEAVYRELGIILPEHVRKRFGDVTQFHESVVKNRRSYLAAELRKTRARIAERVEKQERLDRRRSEVMGILQSSGALEQYTEMQGELSRINAESEALQQKFDTAEALESGTAKQNLERARLLERLQQDLVEQRDVVDRATVIFEEISRSLYEDGRSGSLIIEATKNGPRFDVQIQGKKSKGVTNMQTFCLDMTLMVLNRIRGKAPGFLVHDSHLFDGVDERQVGIALETGARLAEQHNFQYLVTMNTDVWPRFASMNFDALPHDFDLENHVLPVRLTDDSEDGGLFGFRF
jgi:uncharacterized protein YydD (DUF2326 family)